MCASHAETCGSACAALNARLQVGADEGVRQALIEALRRADTRPRRFWERWTGRRPWAEAEPQATALRRRTSPKAGPLCGSAVARHSRSRARGSRPFSPHPHSAEVVRLRGEGPRPARPRAWRTAGPLRPRSLPRPRPQPAQNSAAAMASGQVAGPRSLAT